jgi:hypothetical protein
VPAPTAPADARRARIGNAEVCWGAVSLDEAREPRPQLPSLSPKAEMTRKGTAKQRGYGSRHRDRRKKWEKLVAAGAVACARCGGLIASDSPWDLGHHDLDRTLPTQPEHRHCNRSAAAARGNKLRAKQPAELPPVEGRWSRVW